MLENGHVRFGKAACGNGPAETPTPRPRPTPLGRLAWRDVEIHHEPESWTVEIRQGRPEGEARRWGSSDRGRGSDRRTVDADG